MSDGLTEDLNVWMARCPFWTSLHFQNQHGTARAVGRGTGQARGWSVRNTNPAPSITAAVKATHEWGNKPTNDDDDDDDDLAAALNLCGRRYVSRSKCCVDVGLMHSTTVMSGP